MKKSAVICLLFLFVFSAFAQKPKTAKNISKTKLVKSVDNVSDEKEEFRNAAAQVEASERVTALQKFISDFPESEEKIHAQELLVSGRAQIGEEKLRSNDIENGIEIFKLAVKGIPTPVSDKLFTDIILQIPTNIFFRGQRPAATEVARLIEEKIEGNPKQLLGLATFYIGTENAGEAQRLAKKAIEIEPAFPAAYQTLGLANRMNFQLEDSAEAYAKALELDKESIVSKRSLAEMKRAVGKPAEAVELYREIISIDSTDLSAETGLILALFDADKKAEAETEMAKALDNNPSNLFLLVGASYWYAAHGNGDKSVEFGQRAVAVEPRYTWGYIALARGLSAQNRPLDAERTLLIARQYGNFPTLDYELASVRMAAGFYREAVNGLKKTFSLNNGEVYTKLGGRVGKRSENFIELLSAERRASIFEAKAADNIEDAKMLKSLLAFSQQLDSTNPNVETISASTDSFVEGGDEMKLHRQIYAANRLLEKRVAPSKALELTKAALGNVDKVLSSPNASSAVLADELYDSRTLAISRNEMIVVPEIPRQTLSKILRGRIEDLAGSALLQQQKPEEAVIRFKRALSVLPEKSSWWRDSWWKMGLALQGEGKADEALQAYYKSYTNGAPELSKRILIEVLYQKTNGSLEGLDEKIGVRPESTIADLAANQETVAQVTEQETAPTETSAIVSPLPTEKTPELVEIASPPVSMENSATVPNADAESKLKEEIKENSVETVPTPTSEIPDANQDVLPPEILPVPKPEETPAPELDAKAIVEKPSSEVETQQTANEELNESDATPETLPEKEPVTEIREKSPINDSKSVTDNVSPSENQVAVTERQQSPNSLFDPIVITVPRAELLKKKESAASETTKESSILIPKDAVIEEKRAVSAEETEFTIKRNLLATRPRVAGQQNNSQQCTIITSQEAVSILNDGGSLGILVGFKDGGGDVREIKSTSGSPTDIEIRFEPEIGALSGRAFFIVKSVSQNKGTYSGIFEAPCGKKEITIKVR